MALPDLLKKNIDVVFVGTAVTESSKNVGAYYATHGNKFYKIIQEIGLTETEINPQDYKDLLKHGIGLTDLVKNRTGLDNDLDESDFDVDAFKKKIKKFKPKIVCFNGKLAAAYFIHGNDQTANIQFGLQPQTFGKIKIFVAPSTAQTGNKYWDEKHWETLGELIKENKSKSIIIIFKNLFTRLFNLSSKI